MRAQEIRELDNAALLEQIDAKRHELYNLRIQWITGSLEDPNQLRRARKDLARILTIARERELAAALVEGEGNA